MKSKSQPLSPLFSKLTYDKLALWAGPENAERGKAEMEYVRRLRRMPDGGILASVAGIKEHVACMWFDKSGELLSECTCLEGTNCHHTVSILLRCGETLKAGEEIPLLEEGDERMRALDENIENEAVTKRKGRVRKGDVEGYLATLSKQELEVLVLDLLNQNPQAKQHLITQIDLNGSNNKELIRRISKEIQKLEETQKRRENADTKGRAPDISKFEGLFKNLFERGFYEEVLDLGLALKKVSRELYDTSGKSGDSAILTPLRKCCETIEKARRKTTKSEPERLLWDILYYDGYHPRYMCGGKKVLDILPLHYKEETWTEVIQKLEALLLPQTRPDYPLDRKILFNALQRSNRQDEISEFKKKLAISFDDYARIIDSLIKETSKMDTIHPVCPSFLRHI